METHSKHWESGEYRDARQSLDDRRRAAKAEGQEVIIITTNKSFAATDAIINQRSTNKIIEAVGENHTSTDSSHLSQKMSRLPMNYGLILYLYSFCF